MINKNKKTILFGFLSTVTASIMLVSNAQADNLYNNQNRENSKLEAYLNLQK